MSAPKATRRDFVNSFDSRPSLYSDVPLVHANGLHLEVDPERRRQVRDEVAFRQAVDEARLADGRVSGEDHLVSAVRRAGRLEVADADLPRGQG